MNRAERRTAPSSGDVGRRDIGEVDRHAFASASAAMAAGDLDRAEDLYARCIASAPAHVAALHDLGVVAARRRQHVTAVARFGRVLAIEPDHAGALRNVALSLCELERHDEARAAAERLVALRPACPQSFATLGHVLSFTPDLTAAAAALARALVLDPACIPALLRRARILRRVGKLADGLACCDRLIRLEPGNVTGYVERGTILARLDRKAEAEADFETAFRLDPSHHEAVLALGNLLVDGGETDRAIAVLDRGILLAPRLALLHMNRAILHQRQGRMAEALADFRAAIELDPTDELLYFNAGIFMLRVEQATLAIGFFEQALTIKPDMVEAVLQLGEAHRQLNHQSVAIALFDHARTLVPERSDIRALACWARMHACCWQGYEAEVRALLAQSIAAGSVLSPFIVMAFGLSDVETLLWTRAWSERYMPAGPDPLTTYDGREGARTSGPIRIGYLSADFKGHATAALVTELFQLQDRTRFELFGYNIGRSDATAVGRGMVAALDHMVDLSFMTDRAAAERIASDDIAILVDLKGFTTESRPGILSHRPAPIQVNYLGYPGTMGSRAIDYIVADRIVAPAEHQPLYDEAIVHLPDCYQPNDRRRPRADPRAARRDHGLPPEGVVFCCFNNSYKLTPLLFDIWMRVLGDSPGSVLWLLQANDLVASNIGRAAEERGIGAERIVFAPRVDYEAHMARLGLADLFLDTLPVNAHTTASEALWAGVPVLTCLGPRFVGRVAASLLSSVGLPELITTDLAAYEAAALWLGRNPEALSALRSRLVANRLFAPLFDTPRYARSFDAALDRMIALRDAGRPPEPFAIGQDEAGPVRRPE